MSVKLSSRSKILRKNRLRNSSMQSLDAKKPLVKNRSRTSSKRRAFVPKVTNSDEAEDNFPAIYERSKKTQKYSERKFRRIKRKPKAQVSNSQNKIDITCNNNLYQINQFNVKIINSDSSRESKRSVIRENRTPSKPRKLYHLGSQAKNTRNIIKNPDSNMIIKQGGTYSPKIDLVKKIRTQPARRKPANLSVSRERKTSTKLGDLTSTNSSTDRKNSHKFDTSSTIFTSNIMEKLYSVDYEQEGLKKKYKNRFLNIDDPNRRIKMINKEELNNFVETVKKYRERVAKRKELHLNNSCETPVRSVNQIVNLKIKDDESTNLNSESLNISLPVTSSSKVVHKTPTKVKVKRSKLTKFPKNPKNSKKLKNGKNLKLF